MARSWTTVVAVAGIALLALVLLPGSLGFHQATPAASPRPAASDFVYTTDQYGNPTNLFWVGYANGEVAFTAYDPVDTTATVALNDLTASRDGFTNPVTTWTGNFNAGS